MTRKSDGAELAELLGLAPLPPIDDAGVSAAERALQIGARVRDARVRSGLGAAAVAEAAGLTPDKLSKIEHGKRRIAPRELPGLTRALNVSLAWLLGRPESGRPALALAHRVAEGAGEVAVSGPRGRAIELLEAEDRLSQQTRLPPRFLSPAGAAIAELVGADRTAYQDLPRTRAEARRQGRILAEEVRRVLELGSAEIGDLPSLIEMHFAADVVLSPLGDGSDGLCAHDGRSGDRSALLVINTDSSVGRTRFTLAHELGHHVLIDPREVIEENHGAMHGNGYVEQRVKSFAGHLLLPVGAITAAVAWLDTTQDDILAATPRGQAVLGYLMVRYGVSLPCTLQQVLEAGYLKVAQKEALLEQLHPGELIRAAAHLNGDRPDPDRTSGENRPPARLATAVADAARAGAVGMHTVAVILGRPDNDQLYREVMYGISSPPDPAQERL